MTITLNGERLETAATTLGELLGALPPASAAAVNGEVVRRTDVPAHPLAPGDTVEVVTAVAGG